MQEDPWGSSAIALSSLNSALEQVSGQPYTPPREKPRYLLGGMLDGESSRERDVAPAEVRTPDRPARSPLAILSGVCLKLKPVCEGTNQTARD
jgi:hypothetical protein